MQGLLLRDFREQWETKNLSPIATKSTGYAANRWLPEEPDSYRTSFQRDIGRILYSNAFRRLRTKTQVFTDPDDQHNRTRLTHSLEVSHIARQISKALRLNEDLTEAIAVGHDLGHTPFGHAGERALNDLLQDSSGFSHNAQSVWIVEYGFHGRQYNDENMPGLNLTYAVREGILKHTDVTTNLEENKKFGLDRPATPEGQVVDIADGLAYLYHDIEDGCRNRLLNMNEVFEVWLDETGDLHSDWFATLISDVIENSEGKTTISFSDPMKKAYKAIKNLVKEKVIKSELVQTKDQLGYEMVSEMFTILSNNEFLIPQTAENSYKLNKFGLQRTIIDYIQWLGDQNFEPVLNSCRKRKII